MSWIFINYYFCIDEFKNFKFYKENRLEMNILKLKKFLFRKCWFIGRYVNYFFCIGICCVEMNVYIVFDSDVINYDISICFGIFNIESVSVNGFNRFYIFYEFCV